MLFSLSFSPGLTLLVTGVIGRKIFKDGELRENRNLTLPVKSKHIWRRIWDHCKMNKSLNSRSLTFPNCMNIQHLLGNREVKWLVTDTAAKEIYEHLKKLA